MKFHEALLTIIVTAVISIFFSMVGVYIIYQQQEPTDFSTQLSTEDIVQTVLEELEKQMPPLQEPEHMKEDETEDMEDTSVVLLPHTHQNRLFTLQYPEGWRVTKNESGGLVQILQPIDDHVILTATYHSGKDKGTAACDLSSRDWKNLTATVIKEEPLDKLVRYDGLHPRSNEPQIAYVAISGSDTAIHDCTVLDYEEVWVAPINKTAGWAMMESIQLAI